MKKALSLLLVLGLVLALFAGCGGEKNPPATDPTDEVSAPPATDPPEETDDPGEEEPEGNEFTGQIALITDVGNIDDESFNQGSWTGVVEFAEANGIDHFYLRPSEDSHEARMEQIKAAIDKGASVIVCPGFLFEETIYEAQDIYTETQFLLLDGAPHDAEYNYSTSENTHCILYQEEQAGYFAGYGAVMDGYRELGFLGGMAVPAVVRFGHGFVQGAEDAAAELELEEGAVNIKYWYSDSFAPTDDIKIKMDGWYSGGTEVVFACGGAIYLSAIAAAEAAGGKIIGVDVDQAKSVENYGREMIITSAMKELAQSVVIALTDLVDNGGTWSPATSGKTAVLGAADDCVGLPVGDESWGFAEWTEADYEALFNAVKSGSVSISDDIDEIPETTICTVDVQS